MEGTLILPADIRFIPAAELPDEMRKKIGATDGDIAVTRPKSRAPAKVIDTDTYALLKRFENPTTIVRAVIDFSKERQLVAATVLDEAFPLLESFFESKLLVDPESPDAAEAAATYSAGDSAAGVTVEETLAIVADTEIYRARRDDGSDAVLKLARTKDRNIQYLLRREAAILERGASSGVTPELYEAGELEGRPYLLMERLGGVDAGAAAGAAWQEGPGAALALCAELIGSYARLHAAGIVHGDVHPRNIQVEGGRVRLLDFGVAVVSDAEGEMARAPRAGIGFFFEPEYARAVLAQTAPPAASRHGEQYAVGALCYLLLTGTQYADFPGEKDAMMRVIAETPPAPMSGRGAEVPEAVESVLAKALSKDPAARYESMADFEQAFRVAMTSRGGASVRASRVEKARNEILARIEEPRLPLVYQGPRSPSVSVTYGAAGIAYAHYRMAVLQEDPQRLALADLWASKAAANIDAPDAFYESAVQIEPATVGRTSPYHTASGVHLVQALIATAMDDEVTLGASLDAFLGASAEPCDKLDITLGRFGTLIGLALAAEALPDGEMRKLLVAEGDRRAAEGWQAVQALGRLAACEQEPYLGLAHGWAGFLYAPLRWAQVSGGPAPDGIDARLRELADLAEPHGKGVRWPFHLKVQGTSRHMGGWCNGTAGFVLLWTLAYSVLGEPWLLETAERAAVECAGSPGGIHTLCCGAAGQAYALLSLHRETGEARWLDAAKRKLREGVASPRSQDELPFSLYKGDVGLALLAVEIESPGAAAMPFC